MNYFERFNLRYDREWGDGMRANIQFRREWNEGAGDLFYRPLDGASFPSDDLSQGIHRLTFTELTAGFKYEPGATYVNTRQPACAPPRRSISLVPVAEGLSTTFVPPSPASRRLQKT